MLNKKFAVSLDIYTDEAGTQYVLPDSAELDLIDKSIKELENDAAGFSKETDTQKAIVNGQLEACKKMRNDLENKRKIRETYRKHDNTTKEVFTLKVPTYGIYLSAEAEARKTDEDGNITVDESKLMQSLLTECLENCDALELSPLVAKVLYARLKQRAFPDVSLLPFE